MEPVLHIDAELRKQIEDSARGKSNMCWTCQSCLTECPVNIATNRLNPMKIIRMANFGLLDELLSEPSIWYCMSCNRCNQVCPMTVKPADVITFLREEALRKNLVSLETFARFFELQHRFQRVRWYAAYCCLEKKELSLSKTRWEELLRTPVESVNGTVRLNAPHPNDSFLEKAVKEANTLSCFTCSGCSGSCPVFYERSVFDPQWVFRMANFGLSDELLSSPAIWLCIGCERCTDSCSQLVKGHLIIKLLRALSVEAGFIPISFLEQLRELDRTIYPYLLDEIDNMFGFSNSPTISKEN